MSYNKVSMTGSAEQETPKTPAQTSTEPVAAAAALPAAATGDAPANPVQNTDIPAPTDSPAQAEQSEATRLALSNLEQQLGQLNAHILAMQQQLSDAASEPNAETEEARGTLAVLKAAASEVQSTIAEVKTSRRPVSAAALSQLSARIGGIITEATEESAELNSSVSESRSQKALKAKVVSNASSKSSPPKLIQRTNAAIMGGSAAHEEEEEKEFVPQMNPNDRRNRDGTISGREVVAGTVGLARAATSKKKRATAARIAAKMMDAAGEDDQRGMLDAALAAGRGGARVTGSEDVGHAITVTVGAVVTKSTTAGNLLSDGRVGDMASAAVRNLDGAISYTADITGISSVANWLGYKTLTRDQIEPFIDKLMNDQQNDWERLVNAHNVKQFDTDGNGRIDAGEILGVLRNNGVTFDRVDADDDGRIAFEELRSQLIAIARRNNARVEGRTDAAVEASPRR